MRVSITAFVTFCLVSAASATTTTDVSSENNTLERLFQSWAVHHGRNYADKEEHESRKAIWMDNHEFIEKHNSSQKGKSSFTLGHNQFSDMTLEEYHQHNFLGSYFPGVVRTGETISVDDLLAEKKNDENNHKNVSTSRRLGRATLTSKAPEYPESKDWVKDGAVTEIKNQGHCGSCWAFSTIGAIEGARAVQHKILESLSEQQLVDCDTTRDHGCQGGLMDNAFTYDENSKGLCSLKDYPYVGYKHIFFGCSQYSAECKPQPFTKVVKYEDVAHTEPALKEAISKQPVSVAINAATREFQLYNSGVFEPDECDGRVDHGVLAVGYGTTDDNKGYWLIKNSWGTAWGEDGYVKMSINNNNEPGVGQCGINQVASRPQVAQA